MSAVAASDPWVTQVLHEDEHIRIEWTTRGEPGDTVAVTFDPIHVQAGQPAYAGAFLHKAGVDTLAVRKKAEHFYQPLSRESFDSIAAPCLQRYPRRLAYGSSLGAYAVLYFCRDGFDLVISSSPRVSPHPRHGADFWRQRVVFLHEAFDPVEPATSAAVVFYDPHDDLDRQFVQEELRPAWPRARFRPVPYSGHPTNQFLAEIDFIAPFIRSVVAQTPAPELCRRRKARSATYHQVLAMGCLRHRKPIWALNLAERALQMNPAVSLARRTRGQALLALGRIEEAEACLNEFLQQHPLDGEAQGAMRMLQRQRAAEAAAREAQARPPTGALAWLRQRLGWGGAPPAP